jgi:hypothetical protein
VGLLFLPAGFTQTSAGTRNNVSFSFPHKLSLLCFTPRHKGRRSKEFSMDYTTALLSPSVAICNLFNFLSPVEKEN